MDDDDSLMRLPIDIIYKIRTHITDPASLVRLASTCKFWRDLIKDPRFIDCLKMRRRDHGFTPSLLLGFFYQDNVESPPNLWQYHTDKIRCLAPKFMPMSELSHSIGRKTGRSAARPLSLGTFIRNIGAKLNFYDPVASQDSFLALHLRKKDSSGCLFPDVLYVCNPLAGEVVHIPVLQFMPPDHYALFVTDDVDLDGCMPQFFQLVAIWITDKKTFINVSYSSKTGTWGDFSGEPPQLVHGLYLVPTTTTASHGAVHWLCGSWKYWELTHIVTLHIDTQELSYLELPFEAKFSENKGIRPLLAKSADGGFLLLFVTGLQMSLWKHSSSDTGGWIHSRTINIASYLPWQVVKRQTFLKVRLEMFQGKSGTVVLSVVDEGLFVFSISDGSMRKIDSDNVAKKYSLCPYEIDWLSCLAVTNLVGDLSSVGIRRQKVQTRWRIT